MQGERLHSLHLISASEAERREPAVAAAAARVGGLEGSARAPGPDEPPEGTEAEAWRQGIQAAMELAKLKAANERKTNAGWPSPRADLAEVRHVLDNLANAWAQ